MAKGFKQGAGGGAGLNFKVVCNPQPASAKENTIWVDTDKINNYYFSATQPENMVDYDVWFPVDTSSVLAFSATKKNPIMVYPLFAKQWMNGALVDVTAKKYQKSEWVELISEVYLFNNGDQCGELTGGWARSGIAMNSNHPNTGSFTIGEVIKMSSTSSGSSGTTCDIGTVKPIDLTKYRKICMTGKATSTCINMYITKVTSGYTDTGGVGEASVENRNADFATVEIPVDTYVGEYYVHLIVMRGRSGEVSKIWLA